MFTKSAIFGDHFVIMHITVQALGYYVLKTC